MSSCRLSRRATSDMDSIWWYIAERAEVETADQFIEFLVSKFLALAASPKIGRSAEEFGRGIRRFPPGDYLIYYLERSRGGITVSRVVHGMRNQSRAMSKA